MSERTDTPEVVNQLTDDIEDRALKGICCLLGGTMLQVSGRDESIGQRRPRQGAR
jgi:hypothetical protein